MAVVNIDMTDPVTCKWTEPSRIKRFDDWSELLTWFLKFATVDTDNHIVFKMLDLDDGHIEDLKAKVPIIGSFTRDMVSKLKILFHLSEIGKYTEPQKASLETMLTTWNAEAKKILSQYWGGATPGVPPADASLIKLFCVFTKKSYELLRFANERFYLSLFVVDTYKKAAAAADELMPTLSDIRMARMDKPQAMQKAEEAMDEMKKLESQLKKYFAVVCPLLGDRALKEKAIRDLITNYQVLGPDQGLSELFQASENNLLYRVQTFSNPISVHSWDKYGEISTKIDKFFEVLNNIKVDEAQRFKTRLPKLRLEALEMDKRVKKTCSEEEDATITVESCEVLMDELESLFSRMSKAYEVVDWTLEDFGVARETIFQWKESLLTKKTNLKDVRRKLEKATDAKEQIYVKNLVAREVPMIKKDTWQRFLSLWDTESKKYIDDEARLNFVRSKLEHKVDINATEKYTTLDAMMSYLYLKYGTRISIFADGFDKLSKLPTPGNVEQVSANLVKISAFLSSATDEEVRKLFTNKILSSIVNTALDETSQRMFWSSYEDIKLAEFKRVNENPDEKVSEDEWVSLWDTKYSDLRIKSLEDFCTRQLLVNRNITRDKPSKYKQGQHQESTNVLDPKESWRCPICSQSHRTEKRNVRPYLSCCPEFKAMSVQKRLDTVKRYKYCKVCTGNKENFTHQGQDKCPHVQKFMCTFCKDPKRLSHCNMLCFDQHKSNHQNGQPANRDGDGSGGSGAGGRGRGGRRRRGGGRGGSQQDDASSNTNQSNGHPSCGCQGEKDTAEPPVDDQPLIIEDYSNFSSSFLSLIDPDGNDICLAENCGWIFEKSKVAQPSDLELRHVFQSVLEADVIGKNSSCFTLLLSDSGSTISFAEDSLMQEMGVKPLGQWRGIINSIDRSTSLTTPFYEVTLNGDKKYTIFCLGTKSIGYRKKTSPKIFKHIAEQFRVDEESLMQASGKIRLLIGQDVSSLLLNKLTHINKQPIASYLPENWKNISLQISPLSPKLSVVGTVGGDQISSGLARLAFPDQVYHCTMQPEATFSFYDIPTQNTLALLSTQYTGCIFETVENIPREPPLTVSNDKDADDDDNGEQGAPVQTVVPSTTNSTGQHNGDKGGKDSRVYDTPKNTKSSSCYMPLQWFKYIMPLLILGIATNEKFDHLTSKFNFSGIVNLHSYPGDKHNGPCILFSKEALATSFSLLGLLFRKDGVLGATIMNNFEVNGTLNDGTDNPFYDMEDKRLTSLICEDCRLKTLSCPRCKWLSHPASLAELEELSLIKKNLSIETKEDGTKFIKIIYPFLFGKSQFPILYRAELSNGPQALAVSRTLFKTLNKKKLVDGFHADITKSIELGHMVKLSPEQEQAVLAGPHCFSHLSFALKPTSSSTKIRPVSNTSAKHQSGSCNSWLAGGPNMLASLRGVFEKWRLGDHCVLLDLTKCYRSFYSDEIGNLMRLFYYPDDPYKPLTSKYSIIMMLRMTYGDACASAVLEQAIISFLAPRCKTRLGRKLLQSSRFVDDVLGSADSIPELFEAVLDVNQALESLGLKLKHIISSRLWIKSMDYHKLPSYIKLTTDEEAKQGEVVFSHTYLFMQDQVLNIPKLNVYKKCRGAPSGAYLSDMTAEQVANVVPTRRIVSRLLGQCYDLDGTFLAPLRVCFAIFFHMVCQVCPDWDTPIIDVDPELAKRVSDFLVVTMENIDKIQPFPRSIKAPGLHPLLVHLNSDGATFTGTFTAYLISAKIEILRNIELRNQNNSICRIIMALARLKTHTVPHNELSGLTMAIEGLISYLYRNAEEIFGSYKYEAFPIYVGVDSECTLASLRPTKLHTTVLVRNSTSKIIKLCKEFTRIFEFVQFTFYYISTELNTADCCSKIHPDYNAVSVINSNFWRFGPPCFLSGDFPAKDAVYMTVVKGEITWSKKSKGEQCLCKGSVCKLDRVCYHHSCSDTLYPHLLAGTFCNNLLPGINKNVTWDVLISKLPLLSDRIYNYLCKRRFTVMVRVVARFLLTIMPSEILGELGIPDDFVKDSRGVQNDVEDQGRIWPDQISSVIQRLAFFCITKKSNASFPPPQGGKHLKKFQINGVYFIMTSLSADGMKSIFGTTLVPYIGEDRVLIFRLFCLNHYQRNPGDKFGTSSTHCGLGLTLAKSRSGLYSHVYSRQRAVLSSLIARCPVCIANNPLTRRPGYHHSPKDPRLLTVLHMECAIFCTTSIDILQDINVKAHQRARGKPSYKVSVLAAQCLATSNMAFITMPGFGTKEVADAMDMLALRYRMPQTVIVDAGSSLVSLAKKHQFEMSVLAPRGINFIVLGQGEQSSSFVERGIQECKRLLRSLRSDKTKSIYGQNQDLLELQSKFLLVESIISIRPLFLTGNDDSSSTVCPRQFLLPMVTPELLHLQTKNILAGVFEPSHLLPILSGKHLASGLKELVRDFLIQRAIRYLPHTSGDHKKHFKNVILPRKGDIVIYEDSQAVFKYGIIEDILEKNMVKIICTSHGKKSARNIHSRKLFLIHRPSDYCQAGIPKDLIRKSQDIPNQLLNSKVDCTE